MVTMETFKWLALNYGEIGVLAGALYVITNKFENYLRARDKRTDELNDKLFEYLRANTCAMTHLKDVIDSKKN